MENKFMKLLILLATLVFTGSLHAQTVTAVPEPEHIAIDSRDNVFVAIKYGIIKIAPDGTITNLTKIAGTNGDLDRHWSNLIIDSRDNIYANDGKLIYKFGFEGGKFVGKIFAGQQWTYKLEDGPIATAGFNTIDTMTIDTNDNIYLVDSYDKIKEVIGSNFVTDPVYATVTAKKDPPAYKVLRKISANGMVTTLKTPDGKYILPNHVSGIAIDDNSNVVYASYGRFIGTINLNTGAFSTIAGQPYKRQYCPVYNQGPVATAELVSPENILINKSGVIIYADQRIHRITKIAGGKVSTLAATASSIHARKTSAAELRKAIKTERH